jgi:hypothetical protein
VVGKKKVLLSTGYSLCFGLLGSFFFAGVYAFSFSFIPLVSILVGVGFAFFFLLLLTWTPDVCWRLVL